MKILKELKISKRNGSFRTVVCPDSDTKRRLRGLMPKLHTVAEARCLHEVVHGFTYGRSPVTNALKHVGYRFTLTMDLESFFDSINENHLKDKLPPCDIEKVLYKGVPRQGLPTSPLVANIAASDMDIALLSLAEPDIVHEVPAMPQFVYTRYADDLSFSFNELSTYKMLANAVPNIVAEHGFRLNPSKTRLQSSTAGRRIITGVGVDGDAIHATRRHKRALRAAEHQGNSCKARGLREWSLLKQPKMRTALPQAFGRWPHTRCIKLRQLPRLVRKLILTKSAQKSTPSNIRQLLELMTHDQIVDLMSARYTKRRERYRFEIVRECYANSRVLGLINLLLDRYVGDVRQVLQNPLADIKLLRRSIVPEDCGLGINKDVLYDLDCDPRLLLAFVLAIDLNFTRSRITRQELRDQYPFLSAVATPLTQDRFITACCENGLDYKNEASIDQRQKALAILRRLLLIAAQDIIQTPKTDLVEKR